MQYVIQEISIPATFTAFTITFRISRPGKRITFREYLGEINSEMKAGATKIRNKKLEKYKNRKDEGVQVTIKSKTTDGYPTEKIIEFAYKEGVDLIIIGRTGLAGFAKIKALGSVAKNVSEKAKCPVMLVR